MAGQSTMSMLDEVVMACARVNRRTIVATNPADRAYAEELLRRKPPATIVPIVQAVMSIENGQLTSQDKAYINRFSKRSILQTEKELLTELQSLTQLVIADRQMCWSKAVGMILLVSELVGEAISRGLRSRVTMLSNWIRTLFTRNLQITGGSIMKWIADNGGLYQLLSVASETQTKPTERMTGLYLPSNFVPFRSKLGGTAQTARITPATPTAPTRPTKAAELTKPTKRTMPTVPTVPTASTASIALTTQTTPTTTNSKTIKQESRFKRARSASHFYTDLQRMPPIPILRTRDVDTCSCEIKKSANTLKQQTMARCPRCMHIWCMMDNCGKEFPSANSCFGHQERMHWADNQKVDTGKPYNVRTYEITCNCTGVVTPVFGNNTTQGWCTFCGSAWCLVATCKRKFNDRQLCDNHQKSFHSAQIRDKPAGMAASICSRCGTPRPLGIIRQEFGKNVVNSQCQTCHTVWCLRNGCTEEFLNIESFREHVRTIHKP